MFLERKNKNIQEVIFLLCFLSPSFPFELFDKKNKICFHLLLLFGFFEFFLFLLFTVYNYISWDDCLGEREREQRANAADKSMMNSNKRLNTNKLVLRPPHSTPSDRGDESRAKQTQTHAAKPQLHTQNNNKHNNRLALIKKKNMKKNKKWKINTDRGPVDHKQERGKVEKAEEGEVGEREGEENREVGKKKVAYRQT